MIEFEEKEKLISSVLLLKERNFKISDVLSPMPIEELEGKVQESKSIIGWLGLSIGILGLVSVLYFQLWVSGKAYPLFYGGKPFDVWLSYVPVLFESVVLLASLAIFITFLFEIRTNSKRVRLPENKDFTNDKMAIVLLDDNINETMLTFLKTNFKIERV